MAKNIVKWYCSQCSTREPCVLLTEDCDGRPTRCPFGLMKTYRSIRVDASIWSTEDPALIKKATVVKSHLQEILDSLTQEDIEKYAIKFSWNRD